MRSGLFAALGDFFDDALLVHRQRQRLAHARVIKRFARDVEAEKISVETNERVKVRALEQHVQQPGRNQRRIPDDVRLAAFIKAQRRIRRTDWQDVNEVRLGMGGVQ